MIAPSQQFDIIICGAGSSGLGLAYQLSLLDHRFSIALIDASFSTTENKTWCFWDENSIPDPKLIHHQWNNLSVQSFQSKLNQSLKTHSYYCIKNAEYRTYMLDHLKGDNRFTLIENEITSIQEDSVSQKGIVTLLSNPSLQANKIFDSTPKDWLKYVQPESNMLFQHFVGWEIETKHDCFDPFTALLMDFRTSQEFGFAFVYVLPFSKTHALIELTYFSNDVLDSNHYPLYIKKYLKDHFNLEQSESPHPSSAKSNEYQVTKTEFGAIPMIDLPLRTVQSDSIHHIGLIGGLAKPSTGYAFSRIQRDVKQIAKNLATQKPISRSIPPLKFRFYDMLILDIITKYPKKAIHIFMQLFQKNGFDMMFKFLDEKTSFVEDLKIMASVPSYLDFFKSIAQTSNKIKKL